LASAWLTWVRDGLIAGPDGVAVRIWIRSAGRVQAIRTFAFETSARWYAVGLAQQVREVGITALRPADIPAGPRPIAGLDHILAEGIYGVGLQVGRGFGWLPRRVRAQWHRARTGRP
jgi:hypothetical protein